MYDSALLTMLYGSITRNPSSTFTVNEGIFNDINLSENGSTVLSGTENIFGGLTVDIGASNGMTATISENISGGHTIEFMDPTVASIVGRPSLFGESFTQGGTSIGSIEPTFMGDGIHVMTSNGGTFTGTTDIFSNVGYTSSSVFNVDALTTPTYISDFSSISSLADATSSLDTLDGIAAVDGLDFLDFL